MIITRGFGGETFLFITRGFSIGTWSVKRSFTVYVYDKETEKKRRPRTKEEAIKAVQLSILKTGVVKNTHKPYHPRWNRRYKVDEYKAEIIATKIVERKGMREALKKSKVKEIDDTKIIIKK